MDPDKVGDLKRQYRTYLRRRFGRVVDSTIVPAGNFRACIRLQESAELGARGGDTGEASPVDQGSVSNDSLDSVGSFPAQAQPRHLPPARLAVDTSETAAPQWRARNGGESPPRAARPAPRSLAPMSPRVRTAAMASARSSPRYQHRLHASCAPGSAKALFQVYEKRRKP